MPTIVGVTARLLAAFEVTWKAIQERHSDVPAVVVTIASGTTGGRPGQVRYGHFAAGRWQVGEIDQVAELFISGEGLKRDPDQVLGTLLHEAAHGVAMARNIKDTSRQGRYHNRRFKALGEELGLILEEDQRIGWSVTHVPTKTANQYRNELGLIQAALVAYRHAEIAAPGKAKGNNLVVATCSCDRRIRVAKTALTDAPVICGACGGDFTADDE